jgi:large subunit ribosomal protein L6
MSRIGRKPVQLPKGVDARIGAERVTIAGPLGSLEQGIPPHVRIEQAGGVLSVAVADGAPPKQGGAMQGLARALLNNMVVGVTKGFAKSLDLIGVGYRARKEGESLTLTLGFTEPVVYPLPNGVSVEIKDTAGQKENQVILKGIDKAVIGQVAADLRRLRPPEPYKGKGIRYTGERIRQKAGKAGAR